ncbi:hypothetical protein ACFRDV_22285 [Streptomyces fagopyri]|uniref:hypothetical protein n=1 Tax=Streptomyces fagopyri TaxID=2662397 RepID=UPI0036A176C5
MPTPLEELDAAITALRDTKGAEIGRLDSDNEQLLALVTEPPCLGHQLRSIMRG